MKNKIELTPAQRAVLELKIGREMERNTDFAKKVMERNNHKIKEKIKPSKYLNINFDEKIENKISEWKMNNVFYGIFPVEGKSMTCDDKEISIENNDKILVSELDISNIYQFGIDNIPIHKPLMFIIVDDKGKEYFYIKTIKIKDFVNYNYQLSSYNPNYKPFWIPIKNIKSILEVHEVIREKI